MDCEERRKILGQSEMQDTAEGLMYADTLPLGNGSFVELKDPKDGLSKEINGVGDVNNNVRNVRFQCCMRMSLMQ